MGGPMKDTSEYSTILDQFLKFLRETEQDYIIATQEVQEAQEETQDMLHFLELEEHKYHDYAKISKEIKTIRQRRRLAKDKVIASTPIYNWIKANRQTIKNLEQTLGDSRKATRSLENKVYFPRIRKDIGSEIRNV